MEHPQVVYAPESALLSEPHVICLEPHWLQEATINKPSFLGFLRQPSGSRVPLVNIHCNIPTELIVIRSKPAASLASTEAAPAVACAPVQISRQPLPRMRAPLPDPSRGLETIPAYDKYDYHL